MLHVSVVKYHIFIQIRSNSVIFSGYIMKIRFTHVSVLSAMPFLLWCLYFHDRYNSYYFAKKRWKIKKRLSERMEVSSRLTLTTLLTGQEGKVSATEIREIRWRPVNLTFTHRCGPLSQCQTRANVCFISCLFEFWRVARTATLWHFDGT